MSRRDQLRCRQNLRRGNARNHGYATSSISPRHGRQDELVKLQDTAIQSLLRPDADCGQEMGWLRRTSLISTGIDTHLRCVSLQPRHLSLHVGGMEDEGEEDTTVDASDSANMLLSPRKEDMDSNDDPRMEIDHGHLVQTSGDSIFWTCPEKEEDASDDVEDSPERQIQTEMAALILDVPVQGICPRDDERCKRLNDILLNHDKRTGPAVKASREEVGRNESWSPTPVTNQKLRHSISLGGRSIAEPGTPNATKTQPQIDTSVGFGSVKKQSGPNTLTTTAEPVKYSKFVYEIATSQIRPEALEECRVPPDVIRFNIVMVAAAPQRHTSLVPAQLRLNLEPSEDFGLSSDGLRGSSSHKPCDIVSGSEQVSVMPTVV
jgi:hypothetical protein